MKKLIATLAAFASFGVVYALPAGNPTEASLLRQGTWWGSAYFDPCDPCFCWFDVWSLRAGFYGNYVYNRKLKIRGHEGFDRDIRHTRMNTNAGYLALNVADKIDIFGTAGMTNITFQTSDIAWSLTSTSDGILATNTQFSWSAGARATLFQWNCFGVGVEGQYFRTNPDLSYFLSLSDGEFTYFNSHNDTVYQEWETSLGLSYTYHTVCPDISLVPYASVTWSWVRFAAHNFTFTSAGTLAPTLTIYDLKATRLWGYALGISFALCDRVGVTVEGSFANENALYVNGQFRF